MLYRLKSLLQSSVNIGNAVIARYRGDRAYGRFGDMIKFFDVNGDAKEELIISAPRRTDDLTEEFYGGMTMCVVVQLISGLYL